MSRLLPLLSLAAGCTLVLPEKVDIDADGVDGLGNDPTSSTSTSDDSWTTTTGDDDDDDDNQTTTTTTTTTGDGVSVAGGWAGLVDCPTYGAFSALYLDLGASGAGSGAFEVAAYAGTTGTTVTYYMFQFDADVSPATAPAGANQQNLTVDATNCSLYSPYYAETYCETFDDVVWAVQADRIDGVLVDYLAMGEDCPFSLDLY